MTRIDMTLRAIAPVEAAKPIRHGNGCASQHWRTKRRSRYRLQRPTCLFRTCCTSLGTVGAISIKRMEPLVVSGVCRIAVRRFPDTTIAVPSSGACRPRVTRSSATMISGNAASSCSVPPRAPQLVPQTLLYINQPRYRFREDFLQAPSRHLNRTRCRHGSTH
jgi:hypothetical protein